MPATERIEIELPTTLVKALRSRVSAGRYASESEAVAAAIEALEEDDVALDAWLRGPLCEAYDAIDKGTATLFTSDEVRLRLARRD